MSLIPWTVRKQFKIIFLLLLIIGIIGGVFLYFLIRPTCLDGKQNQGEKGIDCEGPCSAQCLGEIKPMVVVWVKPVEVGNGKYDAVALIENPNLFLGARSVDYQMKIYDKSNIMLGVRTGKTFVGPGERFVVFEASLSVGNKIPQSATIDFGGNIKWEKITRDENSVVVVGKNFTNDGFARLKTTISNKSFLPVKNIFISAILYDKDKNIIGASSSKIDYIAGEASQEAAFTWPKKFEVEPDSIEVLLRTGLE